MGQRINLNTATKDQLDQIPGMGEHCAQAILDYRAKHGKITNIEELNDIPGFGDKAMEHLRQNAVV